MEMWIARLLAISWVMIAAAAVVAAVGVRLVFVETIGGLISV